MSCGASSPSLSRRQMIIAWGAIVFLAASMRLVGLNDCPAGLFRDEAEKGYSAFALATSGGVLEFPTNMREGAGGVRWRFMPLTIDVMGTRTSMIYQYASVPFVKFFGLTPGSTRMASAVTGSLTVAALGALLLWIWPMPYALAAMLWLALCPWHYVFSRWALQGIFVPLGMTIALAGIAGLERGRVWGAAVAGSGLGFIFYAYSGAEPFALAWSISLTVLYRHELRAQWKTTAIGVAFFLFSMLPQAWGFLHQGSDARLDAISIWTADDATPLRTLGRFIANYLAHFNPVYLFVRGDALARHAIPGFGQLLLLDLVLLPVGAWVALRDKLPLSRALAFAFVLGPFGAAITRNGIPHGLRSLPMVLPATVWGGVGLVTIARWISAHSADARRGRLFAVILCIVCVIHGARVYQIYWRTFRSAPEALESFQIGERKVFESLFQRRSSGERVYVNGYLPYAPYYVLFFGKLDAREIARTGLEKEGFTFFDPSKSTREARMNLLRANGGWLIDGNGVRWRLDSKPAPPENPQRAIITP